MTGRAIMLQGTGSSVGKSVLCAALCRIFARRGIKVAPFKAQNMSNNAYVTLSGGEISRAQVVQATAAGVEPTVDMNPVLLKPEGELGSQVVLHGRVWGRLKASEYLTRKPLLWGAVEGSLRRLLDDYELVVIEGAGSPAEINLRAGDIVNMRVAHAADAPVLLVGDIDRGGVFASLVGTLELLESPDRDRVAGFLINRFRGDLDLLRPGLEALSRRTHRPVLGVIGFLHDLDLPEEDAATIEAPLPSNGSPTGHQHRRPRVAAIRLPRLANFDDLDPLRRAGLEVAWVERPSQLGRPDLLVLPGSKSTAADLVWLEETGLKAALIELADLGTPVVGLCGGYQMLGEAVQDPQGVESGRSTTPGLGLLPVMTVLDPRKTTRRASGRVAAARGLLAGADHALASGYEIHVGETRGPGQPLLELDGPTGPRPDGRSGRSGWIVGTYLHGLLDSSAICEAVVANLLRRQSDGAMLLGQPPRLASVEVRDSYDRLADHVEAAIDLQQLFELVGMRAALRGCR